MLIWFGKIREGFNTTDDWLYGNEIVCVIMTMENNIRLYGKKLINQLSNQQSSFQLEVKITLQTT